MSFRGFPPGADTSIGEDYIDHPLQTALTLAELRLDAASISAALLHDVCENCGVAIIDIETRFGAEVAGWWTGLLVW